MSLEARIIATAQSQLGVHEETGTNDGLPAARYNHGDRLPWCAAFVLWVFEQNGVQFPGNHWKNRAVIELWRNLCEAKARIWEPVPAAVVVFNSRGSSDPGVGGWHIGIVENTCPGNLITIEGNVRNRVARCFHSLKDPRIVGFAKWPQNSVDSEHECSSRSNTSTSQSTP